MLVSCTVVGFKIDCVPLEGNFCEMGGQKIESCGGARVAETLTIGAFLLVKLPLVTAHFCERLFFQKLIVGVSKRTIDARYLIKYFD
jgi:hypothetical protein